MSEQRDVLRNAGLVGGATLLSRVLGMVRDQVLAGYFGATVAHDAFVLALRIPNTLRRFFGEGTLTVSTVPVLGEALRTRGREAAAALAERTWTVLALVLLAVGAVGSFAAPLFVRWLAPGWHDEEAIALATQLLRITFPYVVMIGLAGLAQGILNAHGQFFVPAFHPVVYNLVQILAALTVVPRWDPPIVAMAWTVIVAGILQLASQLPALRGVGMRLRPRLDWDDPGVRRIFRMMAPGAIGVAIYQANILVGTVLASQLEAGRITYLYLADRLFQLPLGLFAVGLGSAVLPTFSTQAGEGRGSDLETTSETSVRALLFLTVPSAVGLTALAVPIVSVLFQRGAFGPADTTATAMALRLYVVGLVPIAVGRILAQVFYSFEDARTPVVLGIASFAVNLAASLLLLEPLGHGGLALATSIAAWFQLVATLVLVRRRYLPGLRIRALVGSLLRMTATCVPMALVLPWVVESVDWLASGGTVGKGFALTGAIALGLVAYLVTHALARTPEADALAAAIGRRKR